MMKLLNYSSWDKERNQLRNALQPRKESGIWIAVTQAI